MHINFMLYTKLYIASAVVYYIGNFLFCMESCTFHRNFLIALKAVLYIEAVYCIGRRILYGKLNVL